MPPRFLVCYCPGYMAFIGIDLGTSFIKGAMLDAERGIIERIERVPFPPFLPGLPPVYREVDPRTIVEATGAIARRLLEAAPACDGLLMCSQMHGYVLTDASGTPLSNYISWRDERSRDAHPSGGGSYFDVACERIGAGGRAAAGNEVRPGVGLYSLFRLSEEGSLARPDALVVPLPDFVLARLCGSVPVTEPTTGGPLGALDLITLDWQRDVLERLGLGRLRWPEVLRTGSIATYLPWKNRRVPCYTPVGDQQCALAGAALGEGELSVNISTGSQVAMISAQPTTGNYQTRPYFDGKYLKTVTHIPAGRSLDSLIRLLTEMAREQGVVVPDPWSYMERAVAAVPRTDLKARLTFFSGACGDSGSLENMREENMFAGHLFRAAFENMADNYLECALRIAPDHGWNRIVFSGGVAQRFESLRETTAARLGAGYRVSPSQEDTMLGLLVLAQAFSGRAGSVAEAARQMAGAALG